MGITVKLVKDVEACFHFQELQRLVWGSDPEDIVPNHVTVTAIKNGGGLLAAYAADGPQITGGMVGAAFWWLGVGVDRVEAAGASSPAPKLKACSHMLGVLPEWQGQRVGLRLKLAQRDAVLQQGLTDWVTWTYDPLYRPNGVFNIHRLGATCNTYARNVYGELQDDLNRGVPSDRCQVDWRMNSPHVLHDIDARRRDPDWDVSSMHLLPCSARGDGLEVPAPVQPALDGRPLAVPIPADIGAIRRSDSALSMTWRLYLRDVLEEAFHAGYTMVDCIEIADHGWRYVLVREYV